MYASSTCNWWPSSRHTDCERPAVTPAMWPHGRGGDGVGCAYATYGGGTSAYGKVGWGRRMRRPWGRRGEQDMGDEGWLARHGLYPWFLVISGVCLVVNLVDGMVLMSHGPSVGIGVLLVVCVVADLWMAVRPRIGCWAVFLVLLAGTLSPVPFPRVVSVVLPGGGGIPWLSGYRAGCGCLCSGSVVRRAACRAAPSGIPAGAGDPIVVRIAPAS